MSDQSTIQPLPQGGAIINYPKPHEQQTLAVEFPDSVTTDILTGALLSADSLATVEIVPRETLFGTWFRQGDLGFIFGERGLGKTWLAMDMARSLAEGRQLGPWPANKARRVLYIDGEMPLDSLRDRDTALRLTDGALYVLQHEHLFQKAGCVLNLTERSTQEAVLELCVKEGIEVVFLDNLSCLFSGIKENDADAWELVLPWLLDFRRRKIAVVIVAHAGRTGQNMRGTSRREDAAVWVLRLDAVPEHDREGEGARFITRFTKNRQGTIEEVEPLSWHYAPDGARVRSTFKRLQSIELFKEWVRQGLLSCKDIAEEMGVTKGAVSKMAARGVREKWLQVQNREYVLTGL